MIAADSLTDIGHFVKTHGVRGELVAVIDYDADMLAGLPCIFVDCDGLKVPFFIVGVRRRGSESVLVSVDGVETETAAARFDGKTIYAKTDALPEDDVPGDDDGFYMSDIIGYTVVADGGVIGVVEDFDDSTANVLLLVRRADGSLAHIPAADKFFVSVSPESRSLEMSLPAGLLQLNDK